MSEAKEEIVVTEGEVLTPQNRLSPTSINSFFRCPRCYFFQYIAKLKTPPNINLVKGSIVHKVLEDFFRGYKSDMQEHILDLFNKSWDKNEQAIKDLELPPEELTKEKQDALNIIMEFYISFKRKIDAFVQVGKADNESHAFYLLKPKFRELFVEDKELHCCGYIDRVHEDFNGYLTIADYKTSNRYGVGFPEEYERQLSIYALLYKNQTKEWPHFAAVVFLRFGETDRLKITPEVLKSARDTIIDVYGRTRSVNIEDYPIGRDTKFCNFRDLHDGTADWEDKLRGQKLEEALKNLGEKNGG